MRARHIATGLVFALVAGVVSYQAITAKPPEPYVQLVGSGLPAAPWIRYECRDGISWQVYTTSDGVEIDQPTSREC